MKNYFVIYKNTGRKKYRRGPSMGPQVKGARPAPWAHPGTCGLHRGPLMLIFSYMNPFSLEKPIKRRLLGPAAASRGGSRDGALLLSSGVILPGILLSRRGKSKPFSSPTLITSWEHPSPSTSSPAPSHVKTLVHLLYSIFVSNLRLVPGVLVVFITSCI
jgi:hypothetical protein